VGFDHACEASLDAFERQLDLQSRQLSKRRVR
jgi:hypothetical protein